MNVFFIGCLHLSHRWMANHRGFTDEFYHDEFLIDSWNSTVKSKKSLIWVLGDISMETAAPYPLLDRLLGTKRVVLGNHDRHQDVRELLKYVETVAGMVDYKGFVLTHCPIHPNEMRFCRGNVHAHTHENDLHEVVISERYNDPGSQQKPTLNKYLNVDAHRLNYKPMSLDQVLEHFMLKETV